MEDIKCPLLKDMLKGLLDPDPEHRLSTNEALATHYVSNTVDPLAFVLPFIQLFLSFTCSRWDPSSILDTSGQSTAIDNR